MKDDIIEFTLAGGAISAPLIGQAITQTPESLVGIASNLTGFGLAVLLVLYNKFYEQPRIDKERREERSEMMAAFKQERSEIIASFRQQMEEKRKDYLADVAKARADFLAQLTQERDAFEAMLLKFSDGDK